MVTALSLPPPQDRKQARFFWFLLLSLFLHTVWLTLPVHRCAIQDSSPKAPPLVARFTQMHKTAAEQVATEPSKAPRHGLSQPRGTILPPNTATTLAEPEPAPSPESPRSGVDVERAFSTARSIAKDREVTPNTTGTTALPATVETAVAKAARSDVVVESRGAAGEWVTRQGKTRCVTPMQVPFYMAGKSMLTQCEAWKG
jgi:hypothetical protein